MYKCFIIYFFIFFVSLIHSQELELKPIDDTTSFEIDKMLIVCLSAEETYRFNFENMMKHSLSFHTIHATSSNEILPQKLAPSQELLDALTKLITSLSKNNFNSLMIATISGTEMDATEMYDSDAFSMVHFNTYIFKIAPENSALQYEMCISLFRFQLENISTIEIVNQIVDQLVADKIIPQKKLFVSDIYKVKLKE